MEDITPSEELKPTDHIEEKGLEEGRNAVGDTEAEDDAIEPLKQALERLDIELVPLDEGDNQGQTSIAPEKSAPSSPEESDPPHADVPSSTPPPLYEDPTGEDDGEGEWITPENVSLHKARALGLTPSENGSAKGKKRETIPVGCMTADFAMQNVLLQMDLSLVGMEGKKIQKVKTWVLRCHACFKCVNHLPELVYFLRIAHSGAEFVRMRQRSSALRAAILRSFAHLLLYHPPLLPRMHLPCKYT